MTAIPTNGSNVQIGGIDGIWYKLVNLTEQAGGVGNYSARIQVSPAIGIAESPNHSASITMRIRFSQVRLTGHDFLELVIKQILIIQIRQYTTQSQLTKLLIQVAVVCSTRQLTKTVISELVICSQLNSQQVVQH